MWRRIHPPMPNLLFNPDDHPDLTYADVFLVPHNPIVDRLKEVAGPDAVQKLVDLRKVSDDAQSASEEALGSHWEGNAELQGAALRTHQEYRGYLMALVSQYASDLKIISRDDVDMRPIDGFGNLPIVIANMNAVTGKRMAEAVAMMGGSAAIPQDKSDAEMREIADYLHSRDVRYLTPVTADRNTKVHELKMRLGKRDIDTAVVLDDQQRFEGLIAFQKEGSPVSKGVIPHGVNADETIGGYVRTEGYITAKKGVGAEEAYRVMEDHNIHLLPILDDDRRVVGIMTRKHAGMSWRYKPHVDEQNGGLAMLATVGALNKNPVDRVKFLLDIGAKGIVFDTAHFDQGIEPYRNVEAARSLIEISRQKIFLVAGNVVTPEATRDMIAAGVDAAKVGVGPGAMCTTRVETAVGRPQFSAVHQCAKKAASMGKYVWADGGIQYPRDINLALAAGASQVMVGSLFTPTIESPSPFEHDDRGAYKVNFGMASRKAATLRTLNRIERDMRDIFRSVVGQRAEGISAGKVYQQKGRESVADLVHYMMDGVTSNVTYLGGRNMRDVRRYAQIGVQTMSGYEEGKAKPVS